jgi:hypothetical protein
VWYGEVLAFGFLFLRGGSTMFVSLWGNFGILVFCYGSVWGFEGQFVVVVYVV